jgi:hypothetical protein
VLRAIWTAAGYPWSVRLQALLPLWLPWARRRLRLTAALEAQVRRISPRQIDRCLRADMRTLRRRQYGRTRRYDRPQTSLARVRQSTRVQKGRVAALVTLQHNDRPLRVGAADRSRPGRDLPTGQSPARRRARGRCPTCGRPDRVHKVAGKPQSRFSTAPTRRVLFSSQPGNPSCGAMIGRSVTVSTARYAL